MKRWKLLLAIGSLTLLGAFNAYANHHEGKMGEEMGRGMPHPKCGPKGGMHSTLVATTDGGVVVLCGKQLVKYDKNLKLVKEVELECSCCAKKGDEAGKGMGEMCPRSHGGDDKKPDEKKGEESKPADVKKAAPEAKPAEPAKK
jgi:hypothetical protein